MAYQYLFTKLIYCNNGHTMRGIQEYQTHCYICSSYSKNTKSCSRNLVEENTINEFVLKYCILKRIKYQPTKKFMRSIIDRIIVNNKEFEIYYKDKTYACFKKNCIKYV